MENANRHSIQEKIKDKNMAFTEDFIEKFKN